MAVDIGDALDLVVGVATEIDLRTAFSDAGTAVTYEQDNRVRFNVETEVRAGVWSVDDNNGRTIQHRIDVDTRLEPVIRITAESIPANDNVRINLFYDTQIDSVTGEFDMLRLPVDSITLARLTVDEEVNPPAFPLISLPGNGDSILLPKDGFFQTADTTSVTITGGTPVFTAGGTEGARTITLTSDAIGISADFNYSGGNYTYPIKVRQAYPPQANISPTTNLAEGFGNIAFSEAQVQLPPGGELHITRQSLINMLPDSVQNAPTVTNIGVSVRQGANIARYESNTLILGRTTRKNAHRYSVGIAIQNTSITGNPIVWAFYWIVAVCRYNGDVPLWSRWDNFETIPVVGQTALPEVPVPTNPPVPPPRARGGDASLVRAGLFPPPQRSAVLHERPYTGTLPERSSEQTITYALGEITQTVTGVQIVLQDKRRLDSPRVVKLEGGLYDVPKLMNDQFYLDWPIPREIV